MEWAWLPFGIPPFIALVYFVALFFDKGWIGRRKPKESIYQQPMFRRWTEKRKADVRLEKAEWDVEYTKLEAKAAIGFIFDSSAFASVNVLEFAKQTDYDLYKRLLKHNDELQYKNEIKRYASYWEEI